MDYYGLKSIISSQKQQVMLRKNTDSFFVPTERQPTYVEPKFSKVEFPVEKPAVILISAVGASGKTATAQALSKDTDIPILDLAKHKPVGDSTLSGILIDHYPDNTTDILMGLAKGECGIIIDGIDEGRNKVTEEAFEAFLDDVVKRTKDAQYNSIVILGRSETLINTWCYLKDQNANVGLLKINTFDIDQAKRYIDIHVAEFKSVQETIYKEVRDDILEKLGAAFKVDEKDKDAFIAFLGYPPVLNAISTLLCEEKNYHRLRKELNSGDGENLEVNLLISIGDYLLDREQKEKAKPNPINEIADNVGGQEGNYLKENLYNRQEQCARILALTLGSNLKRKLINDPGINQAYENKIKILCSEHPFLQEKKLRNPVFEAISLARCALSEIDEYRELAFTYSMRIKPTYHLLYIVDALSSDRKVDFYFFNMLMQSCTDFIGIKSSISIDVEGDLWDDENIKKGSMLTLSIYLDNDYQKRTFIFNSSDEINESAQFGPNFINTRMALPCDIAMVGINTIHIYGECLISAKNVEVRSPEIFVSRLPQLHKNGMPSQASLTVDAKDVFGHVDIISPNDALVEVICSSHKLDYPLSKHAKTIQRSILRPDIQKKYNILRRILIVFRSHSRGGLARYKGKIEHRRILKNDGKAVLEALCRDGILTHDTNFYYIQPQVLSERLGINWDDLKQKKSSPQLEEYLSNINPV
ncbi:MAG: hypothetical protein JW718_07755 [Desulfovibrionaceae bacterium]|nr:hypothetical protein [Desulfovibrionaceae bacterium]